MEINMSIELEPIVSNFNLTFLKATTVFGA